MDGVGQLLVENGANVNQRPFEDAQTALQSACWHGNIAMVSLLLQQGADVNTAAPSEYTVAPVYGCRCWGHTALQVACKRGHVEVTCMLLQHGATIDTPASDLHMGRTALQAACEAGHLEIVNLLINHRADVNAPAGSSYGVTAIQAAAIKRFFRIVQILVAAGADVAAPASAYEGRTAIDGAAEQGRLDIVHYLLDHYEGTEPISAICGRARPYAWNEGHLGVVQLLDEYQRHPA